MKSKYIVYEKTMAQQAIMPGLNTTWLDAISYASKYSFKSNSYIPYKEIPGLYYLYKGSVKLIYHTSSGQSRVALYYKEGSIFNEARTFSGYFPDGTFICMQNVEIYRFKKEDILNEDFIIKFPNLIINLLSTMGAKILLHYTYLSDMGTGNHITHLCKLILSMATSNNNLNFSTNLTQDEVAAILGVHRVTVARTIKKLIDYKIIEKFTKKNIIIKNYDLLKKVAIGEKSI